MRSLNDASLLLTSAEVSLATSQCKLEQIQLQVKQCRKALESALEAETLLLGEVRRFEKSLASVKSTWHRLGHADDEDDVCDSPRAQRVTPQAQLAIPQAQLALDGTKAGEVVANLNVGHASDFDGVSSAGTFVSVLAPSPYTPNPQGAYRSPLTALRVYVASKWRELANSMRVQTPGSE